MTNQLQKLATIHAALVLELTPLAQKVADVLALVEAIGPQVNVVLTLAECPDFPPLCYDWSKVEWPPIPAGSRVRLDHGELYTKTGTVTEDVGPYCKIDVGGKLIELGKRWLTVLETPPVEFAQTFDQLGGFGFDRGPEPVISEMAVHVPSTIPPPIETNEIGAIVHSEEFAPNVVQVPPDCGDGVVLRPLGVELPATKPKRAKTEYTAKEWAMSSHFLHLMKRQHPFNTWTAEQQNAKRDEFVASVSADERMNRWGQRFAKFCGVST